MNNKKRNKKGKKLEPEFQSNLIKRIKTEIPGVIVLKMNPNYKRGVPDLQVVGTGSYAFLECKRAEDSKRRALQDYYVDKLNSMSYASFVYPENEESVMNDLRLLFSKDLEKPVREESDYDME